MPADGKVKCFKIHVALIADRQGKGRSIMKTTKEESKRTLLGFVKKLNYEQAEVLISRLPEWISLLEGQDLLYPLEQVEQTG